VKPNVYDANCPTRTVLDRIGDKWTVLAVLVLLDGPQRFGQLRERIGGVAPKVLTETVRRLERDGIVRRTAFDENPPRVQRHKDSELMDRGFRENVFTPRSDARVFTPTSSNVGLFIAGGWWLKMRGRMGNRFDSQAILRAGQATPSMNAPTQWILGPSSRPLATSCRSWRMNG